MSEPHFTLPKVAIQFGGKERFLCYPNRSLRRLRDERKVDAIKVFQDGEILDTIPVLLWTGLLWADPENPDVAIRWDPDNPNEPLDPNIKPIEFGYVDNCFLDDGCLELNREWSLKIAEGLTGKKMKDDVSGDPPPPDGVQS